MRNFRLNDRASRRRRVTTHLVCNGEELPHQSLPTPEPCAKPAGENLRIVRKGSAGHRVRMATDMLPSVPEPESGPGLQELPAVDTTATERPRSQHRPTAPPPGSRSTEVAQKKIGEKLQSETPLKWLLGGDNLIRPGNQILQSVGSSLADLIHGQMGRNQDLIIDLTEFGQRIKPELVDRLVQTLSSEEPDMLVLMCGNRDASQGMEGFQRFEESLTHLLFQASLMNVPVILNTPPCLNPAASDAEVDRLVYHEMMISTALEYDAMIVDHWSYWEWAADANGSLGTWLSTQREVRIRRALEEICKLLLTELDGARASTVPTTE